MHPFLSPRIHQFCMHLQLSRYRVRKQSYFSRQKISFLLSYLNGGRRPWDTNNIFLHQKNRKKNDLWISKHNECIDACVQNPSLFTHSFKKHLLSTYCARGMQINPEYFAYLTRGPSTLSKRRDTFWAISNRPQQEECYYINNMVVKFSLLMRSLSKSLHFLNLYEKFKTVPRL